MANFQTQIDQLDAQLGGLEQNLTATTNMSAAFQQELSAMQAGLAGAGREATGFSRSLNTDMRRAFGDLVFEGAKVSDVFRNVAKSMISTTLSSAIRPVTGAISGALTGGLSNLIGGILPFAKGGVFSGGHVTPFAKGGIVSSPANFPMQGGLGLMGEAGPEAIVPLARGPDGALGIRGGGGNTVTVNMHISTPDVAGFKRSSSQIAAGIQRAIARGQRNN
ncbi:MAG: phage tail tape measure protein [Rhodobacterales bacterium]